MPLVSPRKLKLTVCRFGYDSAFVGTTISRASFKKDFGITTASANDVSSNITSVFQAGAFFGALFCFFSELESPRTETFGLVANPASPHSQLPSALAGNGLSRVALSSSSSGLYSWLPRRTSSPTSVSFLC